MLRCRDEEASKILPDRGDAARRLGSGTLALGNIGYPQDEGIVPKGVLEGLDSPFLDMGFEFIVFEQGGPNLGERSVDLVQFLRRERDAHQIRELGRARCIDP